MTKIYVYAGCDTCRKALKFLDGRGISYQSIPVRETPPSQTELRRMLDFQKGEIKKLFNISGLDYRTLNLKEKMSSMSEDEAIKLLSQNGNLIKRPFFLSEKIGLVGFKEEQWKKL
jgi:arsenate reductase